MGSTGRKEKGKGTGMDEPSNTPAPARFDVFISYSSKDQNVADATCATLEQAGIRCWIAPRNVPPGSEWGEAIIGGLDKSKVFVLIFSNHANESTHVKREVERAVSKGMAVLPVRIENVVPQKSLEFFISSAHWLDAFPPPAERYLAQLATSIRSLLHPKEALPVSAPIPRSRRALYFGVGVLILGLAAVFLFWPRKPLKEEPLVSVHLPRNSFQPGDQLSVQIEAHQAGFLRVLNVNGLGHVTALYPHPWSNGEHVEIGSFVLPDYEHFGIVLQLPEDISVGNERIITVFSNSPFKNPIDTTGNPFVPTGDLGDEIQIPYWSETIDRTTPVTVESHYTIRRNIQ